MTNLEKNVKKNLEDMYECRYFFPSVFFWGENLKISVLWNYLYMYMYKTDMAEL